MLPKRVQRLRGFWGWLAWMTSFYSARAGQSKRGGGAGEGMMAYSGLYSCKDPQTWQSVLSIYWDVIEAKSVALAKGGKQGKLTALDKWYQEELPATIMQRPEKFLTHEEVVKLMEWKLMRGKFRPRLQQMVASNPSSTVEACTRRAFQLLPDVTAAITELSKLKALGPATASAVLAAGAPESAAFMADEAVEAIPGLTPIQYTLKHYISYLCKIRACALRLNEACSIS
ncbi:uncharacterized protein ZGC:112496 isoform X2 [Latimeria chalumnae]|uniref:uncharacterized protein ZGC:112496 isoform X2 n=1 Tax=Latimeria chalumnae TaxID=7897 RepID=UPI0003C11306|nr:PREDICTED: uncharacterized protein LOC102357549 isoform X2 [Latimeria chalumnae]|eukprot:XP_006005583.1 PREDICTED: uncharacterized protein LOC102357549 isoform X2 [Latimeria chalumnae]